ncbi:MAG: hypothetical protein JO360_08560, partial [Acidobacteria bacterium]|nr:hypothetical protein [Acidobacteriota bacterium]
MLRRTSILIAAAVLVFIATSASAQSSQPEAKPEVKPAAATSEEQPDEKSADLVITANVTAR